MKVRARVEKRPVNDKENTKKAPSAPSPCAICKKCQRGKINLQKVLQKNAKSDILNKYLRKKQAKMNFQSSFHAKRKKNEV